MNIKRELSKIIDDWLVDNCTQDSEYENLAETLPFLVSLIEKKLEENNSTLQYEYSYTAPFVQCDSCGRPFGEWKNNFNTFTDEKLYYPGTRILLKSGS